MSFLTHLSRFLLLLIAMWAFTYISFGIFLNAAITFAAYWTLTD